MKVAAQPILKLKNFMSTILLATILIISGLASTTTYSGTIKAYAQFLPKYAFTLNFDVRGNGREHAGHISGEITLNKSGATFKPRSGSMDHGAIPFSNIKIVQTGAHNLNLTTYYLDEDDNDNSTFTLALNFKQTLSINATQPPINIMALETSKGVNKEAKRDGDEDDYVSLTINSASLEIKE
jgi:hypothetical protein